MISTILLVYAMGWVGATGYNSYRCETDPPQRAISKGECHAIGVVGGAVWPALVVSRITEKDGGK